MKCAAEFRADARRALKGNWWTAILAGFVAVMVGATSTAGGVPSIRFNFGGDGPETNLRILGQNIDVLQLIHGGSLIDFFQTAWVYLSILGILISIAQLIIGCIIAVGYAKFNLDLTDGRKATVNTLFGYSAQWKTMLAAGLLQALYIILWSLLFIIPGIIAAYRYSMTSYILAENPELRAGEAIARSKEMMKGNKWRLFCLYISFIGWMILCAVTMGLGNIWVLPYMETAIAAFYRDLVPLASTEEMQVDIVE